MQKNFLALALIATLSFSVAASAQNVLLPKDNPTFSSSAAGSSKAVVPSPQIDSQTPGAAPAPISLPTLSAGSSSPSVGGQTPLLQAAVTYLPPAQQSSIAAMEKRNLDGLQQSMSQVQQLSATLAAQAKAGGQSAESRARLAQNQQMLNQAAAQMDAQIQQSRQRLAVLSSGSVKTTDLSKLYQGN